MYILVKKLKTLKFIFRKWNKDIFGDVRGNADQAMEIIDSIHFKRYSNEWVLNKAVYKLWIRI